MVLPGGEKEACFLFANSDPLPSKGIATLPSPLLKETVQDFFFGGFNFPPPCGFGRRSAAGGEQGRIRIQASPETGVCFSWLWRAHHPKEPEPQPRGRPPPPCCVRPSSPSFQPAYPGCLDSAPGFFMSGGRHARFLAGEPSSRPACSGPNARGSSEDSGGAVRPAGKKEAAVAVSSSAATWAKAQRTAGRMGPVAAAAEEAAAGAGAAAWASQASWPRRTSARRRN